MFRFALYVLMFVLSLGAAALFAAEPEAHFRTRPKALDPLQRLD